MIWQKEIALPAYKRGFHIIDSHIIEAVNNWPEEGMCNIFLRHTSAGLAIGEGADADVRKDMQAIFDKLVPENQSYYTHTMEGPDDMPAHAKMALTGCSLTIPVMRGELALGTWQSVYLCEFRNHGESRKIVITIYS